MSAPPVCRITPAAFWSMKSVASIFASMVSTESASIPDRLKRIPSAHTVRRWGIENEGDLERPPRRTLVQAGAAERLHVMLALGGLLKRQRGCNPGQRDIGLRAAQRIQRRCGDVGLPSHGRARHKQPMRADVIVAQSNGRLR